MINKIIEILRALVAKYTGPNETVLDSPEAVAYSTMVVNNLEQKYDGKLLAVPIQFINFDVILEALVEMGHPSVMNDVTEPYEPTDFEEFPDEIAELIADYMNTRLKILVNTVIQDLMKKNYVKMSADQNGVRYYTDEPDGGIDGLLQLERSFRDR